MGRKYETRVVQLTDSVLKKRIREFESLHKMTSREFLLRFNSGELGDDISFIRWAGLLQTAAQAGMAIPEHADA